MILPQVVHNRMCAVIDKMLSYQLANTKIVAGLGCHSGDILAAPFRGCKGSIFVRHCLLAACTAYASHQWQSCQNFWQKPDRKWPSIGHFAYNIHSSFVLGPSHAVTGEFFLVVTEIAKSKKMGLCHVDFMNGLPNCQMQGLGFMTYILANLLARGARKHPLAKTPQQYYCSRLLFYALWATLLRMRSGGHKQFSCNLASTTNARRQCLVWHTEVHMLPSLWE